MKLTVVAFLILTYVSPNRYVNKAEGYSIVFPKGWTTSHNNNHTPSYTAAYSPISSQSDYAEIKVVVLSGITADELPQLMQQDIVLARSVTKTLTIEQDSPITVGGCAGRLLQLSLVVPGRGLIRMITYGFAQKHRLYFIRCFVNDAYYKRSANIIRTACLSFRIN